MILGIFLFGAGASMAYADITTSDTCCTYTQDSFTQAAGVTNTFVNPASVDTFHNVTAVDSGPDGKALFESGTEAAGGSSPINGTQYLAAGTYSFYCTIHTTAMSSQLVVEPGTPVARPSVKLTVPSQKLKKVRSSGKLKVSLKGLTDSTGVSFVAKAGSKKLGSASGANVTSGAKRTITIKLTSAGKKALKNKKKVSVSVVATVPFGKSVSASRKLH